MHELRIGKLEPTKRLLNEGSLLEKVDGKKIKVGDYTEWNGKEWKVFYISPAGLLTLQKTKEDQIPASVVLTAKDAKQLKPLIKIIKG